MAKKPNSGFSLVEIMVVVVIVGIIVTIALPNHLKSSKTSQKTICIANLKEIDSAIDRWVLENRTSVGTIISGSEEEIYNDYVKGGKPKCPAGGGYTLYTVGIKPQVTCSKEDEGHTLPQ